MCWSLRPVVGAVQALADQFAQPRLDREVGAVHVVAVLDTTGTLALDQRVYVLLHDPAWLLRHFGSRLNTKVVLLSSGALIRSIASRNAETRSALVNATGSRPLTG